MGNIQFTGDEIIGYKILFVDGKIAMEPDCCCGDLDCTPCNMEGRRMPDEVFVELSGITTADRTGTCGDVIDTLNGTFSLRRFAGTPPGGSSGACTYTNSIPGVCLTVDDIEIEEILLLLRFQSNSVFIHLSWLYGKTRRDHIVDWHRTYNGDMKCYEFADEDIPFLSSSADRLHFSIFRDRFHFANFSESTAKLTVPSA